MNFESSSFDDNQSNNPILNTFSDIVYIERNGATSDCFKVRIYGKWHFLKRPKKAFVTNPVYIAAFEKEFDLGFTLDHPNIVRYLSKGTDEKGIFILNEYIDGTTLNEFIKSNPDYYKKDSNVKKFILQLLSSLEYLHARQIVHLDIKPENIIITTNGNNVKLIDLGLSYSDCYNEIAGGTQSFGSPEQFSKPHLIDYRSDIYAFGKILLYILTGNTSIVSTRLLPARYRNLARKCLIIDIDKRKIKAIECIELINKKNTTPFLLLSSSIIALFLLVFWIYTENTVQTPSTEKITDITDTVFIKQSPKSEINQNYKEKINYKDRVEVPSDKDIKTETVDSIEQIVRIAIKSRLAPNVRALNATYLDMNEFNIDVLKASFENWKKVCENDSKLLYKDYEFQMTYEKFHSIYKSELDKINAPIQNRLDEFK